MQVIDPVSPSPAVAAALAEGGPSGRGPSTVLGNYAVGESPTDVRDGLLNEQLRQKRARTVGEADAGELGNFVARAGPGSPVEQGGHRHGLGRSGLDDAVEFAKIEQPAGDSPAAREVRSRLSRPRRRARRPPSRTANRRRKAGQRAARTSVAEPPKSRQRVLRSTSDAFLSSFQVWGSRREGLVRLSKSPWGAVDGYESRERGGFSPGRRGALQAGAGRLGRGPADLGANPQHRVEERHPSTARSRSTPPTWPKSFRVSLCSYHAQLIVPHGAQNRR